MITVFGSINLDQIGTVVRLPRPGETVAGGTFTMAAGGKGANQALAARRAGAKVRLASAVGADAFADPALRLLREAQVDLAGLRITDAPTGIAMIFVDGAGENVIAILPGANGRIGPADAETSLSGLSDSDTLLVQQELPQAATRRALEIAQLKGARTILNIAPFLQDTASVAPMADIVVANETEFSLLTGCPVDRLNAGMEEWTRSTGKIIVVTLGAKGVWARSPNELIKAPAYKVEPVDTVGAGDTFCGFLAAALDRGFEFETSLQRAAIAGSLACLTRGAQPAIPTIFDVDGVWFRNRVERGLSTS